MSPPYLLIVIALGLLCSEFVSSESVARLEVALYQFENNLNYRFRSDCCLKASAGCDSQCDLTFRLCFRAFDAEEREERADGVESDCEIGLVNVSRRDIDQNSGHGSFLRKAVTVLHRWPVRPNFWYDA